ncbi:MAG: hypothetical protein JO219_05965, partial [Candidatus Eremiobacteraeota bacterium]|nr:hypothetical protein [Candidatus Eremiobacteraeota bacterium]
LGLRTEASARHEKNLPLELPELGRRAAAVLLTKSGATPSRVVAVGAQPAKTKAIAVRPARVNDVLGTQWESARMSDALTPIGFAVSGTSQLSVTPPYWRGDVADEIDVVEEVARCIGYDAIPEQRTNASPQTIDEGVYDREELLAARMAEFGYHEVVTLALQGSRTIAAWQRSGLQFWNEDLVTVVNPLSDEQRFLRPSLLPGILENAARVWKRSSGELRLFELGHVFHVATNGSGAGGPPLPPAGSYEIEGVLEWPSLCALAAFDDADDAAYDGRLLQVKGDVESLVRALSGAEGSARARSRAYFHPGAAGTLDIDGHAVAKFGRLHPSLARAYELPERTYAFMLYLERLPSRAAPVAYRPLPRLQGTQRDIAVVVDERVEAGALMEAIRAVRAPAFESVRAFDEYRGPQVASGKKSIALAIELRKEDATITDAEADASIALIVAALRERFGAVLRSVP